MTRLLWGQAGERLFELGIDRGVVYLPEGTVIPWNGLLSVEEDFSSKETRPVYFDGVKMGGIQQPGEFAATVSTLTYPDALLDRLGIKEIEPGLFVDGQRALPFNVSYRTLLGNDVHGSDYGYKLHLLYNLTASTSGVSHSTISSETGISEVSIVLHGVPDRAPNYRPTAHVILDSTLLSPSVFTAIEDVLYGLNSIEDVIDGKNDDSILDGGTPGDPGTPVVDGDVQTFFESIFPRFPSIEELLDLVLFWSPKLIIPQIETGIASLIPGLGDLTETKVSGIYVSLPSTKLVPTRPDGFYILGERQSFLKIIDNQDGSWTALDDGTHISMITPTEFSITSNTITYIDEDTYTISGSDI